MSIFTLNLSQAFMEVVYENEHGAIFSIQNGPNPGCILQLVIDTVGLFMSTTNLEHLLKIVKKPIEPCHCNQCQGKIDRIWSTNPIVDIRLKVDKPILRGIQDLIKGALFNLDMAANLTEDKLTTNDL